jgi:AP-2 complex subunit mu-1
VLIYEVIDEICDFGYPQLTEISALKSYITQEGGKGIGKTDVQTTGAVSWRMPGIKYRKNEAFSMTYA